MTDPFVPFPSPLVEATFVKREKRFLAHMILPDGSKVIAHCPNTGSLRSCLFPGARAILSVSSSPTRKYAHTWKAVFSGSTWIGIDTGLPNRLTQLAIEAGVFPSLSGFREVIRERTLCPGTRIDLELLADEGPSAFVEVKNVSLVEDGVARFPDAVTVRGRKHLNDLADYVKRGGRGAMVYVVQRGDASLFRPAADIDPEYAKTLAQVVKAGVEVYVLNTEVSPEGVRAAGFLPFEL